MQEMGEEAAPDLRAGKRFRLDRNHFGGPNPKPPQIRPLSVPVDVRD